MRANGYWTVVIASAIAACVQATRDAQLRGTHTRDAQQSARVAMPATPRPALDMSPYLPDFHDELRWPLPAMAHPSLEPRFGIAAALAEPGVGWIDLCSVAQNRHGIARDLRSYLRGWCAAIKGDVETACTHLVPLLGTTSTYGLDEALKLDLANVLADAGHADKAEHWINRFKIRDTEIIDLLAANYVEVGTTDDALTINGLALDLDSREPAATRCHRLTRQILLHNDHRSPLLDDIEHLASKGDETCVQLFHKLRCHFDPGNQCRAFVSDTHGDARIVILLDVYHHAQVRSWAKTFDGARLALPLDGAAQLAVWSLDNSIRIEGCTDWTRWALEHHRVDIERALGPRSALLDPLARMAAACPPAPVATR